MDSDQALRGSPPRPGTIVEKTMESPKRKLEGMTKGMEHSPDSLNGTLNSGHPVPLVSVQVRALSNDNDGRMYQDEKEGKLVGYVLREKTLTLCRR